MMLVVYSKSRSFENHIKMVAETDIRFHKTLSPVNPDAENINIIHGESYANKLDNWLKASRQQKAIIGVASDEPRIESLLEYTKMGVNGYFNAYMAAPHYAQLIRLLSNGQSWYPPSLLAEAFDLARLMVNQPVADTVDPLDKLTKREGQVALAVAEGLSNKLVATHYDISERTVKAHLTQIFKKLQVKDRVALVIYLNGYKA